MIDNEQNPESCIGGKEKQIFKIQHVKQKLPPFFSAVQQPNSDLGCLII
jgi:hypothetical protein